MYMVYKTHKNHSLIDEFTNMGDFSVLLFFIKQMSDRSQTFNKLTPKLKPGSEKAWENSDSENRKHQNNHKK